MRASQEDRDKSHARIIESAAALLRQNGVEGAGIAEVMKHAGLTHGGFYKHFVSKDALLVAALDRAFDEMAAKLDPRLFNDDPAKIAAAFQRFYFSEDHLATPATGCPIAALSTDVARAATQLKTRFGAGVRGIIGRLAHGLSGSKQARQARATRQLAMMAGAVMIARASDPETAREVLAACRK